MAKHINPHTQHGDIHPSFPPQGVPKRAHLGSQSVTPNKSAPEGSPAEEATESPAFEKKEDGAAAY